MALSRLQRQFLALQARQAASRSRPPSRAKAKAWLEPIRSALTEIKGGEVECDEDGVPVPRIRWAGEEPARIEYCLNGFVGMIGRVCPEADISPMRILADKLGDDVPLTGEEVDACFVLLNRVEDALLTFTVEQLKDFAAIEQTRIAFDLLGIEEDTE